MRPDLATQDAHRRGRAQLADVELALPTFAAYLASHPRGAIVPTDLDDAQCVELVLACACAEGDAAALAHFDRDLRRWVPTALAHMKLGSADVDELTQLVREKLLVTRDRQAAKLLGYAGRGRMRGLVQVIAVRSAISMLRKSKREVGFADGQLERIEDLGPDPAADLMKASYRDAFRRAFEQAVAQLESRQRNLLRLHLLGGVTLEKLASMYSVHRATIVRWLARARDDLAAATRAHMREDLDLDPGQLESVMGMIQSRLDASVQRVLRTTESMLRDPGD